MASDSAGGSGWFVQHIVSCMSSYNRMWQSSLARLSIKTIGQMLDIQSETYVPECEMTLAYIIYF